MPLFIVFTIHICLYMVVWFPSFSLAYAPFKVAKGTSTHRNLICNSLFTEIGWHLIQERQLSLVSEIWLNYTTELTFSSFLHVFAYAFSASGVCFLYIFPANYYSFFKTWLEISFLKEAYPNSTNEFIIAPFISLLCLNITTITAPSYCIAIIFNFIFAFINRSVCLRVRAIMYLSLASKSNHA